MERNVELLEKTMRYIEDHPESHNQENWWCGTSGCYAGWALYLHGMSSSCINDLAIQTYGYTGPIIDRAASVLGLNESEAFVLFDAHNTRPMLALMVKDLINGEELRNRQEYLEETQ